MHWSLNLSFIDVADYLLLAGLELALAGEFLIDHNAGRGVETKRGAIMSRSRQQINPWS